MAECDNLYTISVLGKYLVCGGNDERVRCVQNCPVNLDLLER